MSIQWPRGRYNGRRIVGIEFKAAIDLTDWQWIPVVSGWKFAGALHWLCIRTWTNWNYEHESIARKVTQ